MAFVVKKREVSLPTTSSAAAVITALARNTTIKPNAIRLFTIREDAGKFLLDFGKLVFAGIVFGSILRYQIPQDLLLTGAAAVATVSCIVGLILGMREKTTDKTEIRRHKRRKR